MTKVKRNRWKAKKKFSKKWNDALNEIVEPSGVRCHIIKNRAIMVSATITTLLRLLVLLVAGMFMGPDLGGAGRPKSILDCAMKNIDGKEVHLSK